MAKDLLRQPSSARILLALVAIFCVSTVGIAGQDILDKSKDVLIDEPADKVEDVFDTDDDDFDDDYDDDYDDDHYRQKPSSGQGCPYQATEREKPSAGGCVAGTANNPMHLEVKEITEEHIGQTVTVKAEIDDTFNSNVFTIQDDGAEVMVINHGGACSAVQLEGDEWKDGKSITVTGVVQPYDRGKLECAFGPLNMESKEGDGFTRRPVLVISQPQTASVEPMPAPVISQAEPPAPAPEPLVVTPPPPIEESEEVAIIIAEPMPEPTALPRTAGGLPLTGLVALLSLAAAAGVRFYRR
jgi:hypothetical protein